ncbi:hypothetical protein A2U01_0021478, partial [Trifolium medium]|nr:hypothetical protein [Trifolium medium]
MDSDYKLEDITSYGAFTTIFLSNKIYGEVDPEFYAKFKNEFGSDWKIINKDTIHSVKFKKDLVFPLLQDGWLEMKE